MATRSMGRNTLATRWGRTIGVLALLVAVSARTAHAEGDGARVHWKGVLTETNLITLTMKSASGNANPFDPTSRVVQGAEFDANFGILSASRVFSLAKRTAVASVALPFGELRGETGGLMAAKDSARGFGDPILMLDVNLYGAPAMKRMPELYRYEPCFTLDLSVSLALPVGEYDRESLVNIGQNRWYGRVGLPAMFSLCNWVPGSRTTLEIMPSVSFFADNDDLLGQTLKNDPFYQLEGHLTRDLTETLWGAIDATWYYGGNATIGGVTSEALNEVAAGFTLGYQITDNVSLTAGYSATFGDGAGDLDMGVFSLSLVYGWNSLIEGIRRISK
jgi:hypothetical protein